MTKKNEVVIMTGQKYLAPGQTVELEDGGAVAITEEMQAEYAANVGIANKAMWDLVEAIKRIKDESLYAVRGFQSFREWAAENNDFAFGYRQVSKYLKIAEFYGKDVHSGSQVHRIGNINKLEALTRLPDTDIKKIMDDGELELSDGTVVSVDEINDMAVKELRAEIKFLKEKAGENNAALIQQLAKENKRAEKLEKDLVRHRDEVQAANTILKNTEQEKELLQERLAAAAQGGAILKTKEEIRAFTAEAKKMADGLWTRVNHVVATNDNVNVLREAHGSIEMMIEDLEGLCDVIRDKLGLE